MVEEKQKKGLCSLFGFLYLKVLNEDPLDFQIVDINDRFLFMVGENQEIVGKRKNELNSALINKVAEMIQSGKTDAKVFSDSTVYDIKIFNNKNGLSVYFFEDIYKPEYGGIVPKLMIDNGFLDWAVRYDDPRYYPISIGLLDINGLKNINDRYGYEQGDKIINKTAQIIRSNLNSNTIATRLGGNGFAIMVFQTSENEILSLLFEIKRQFEMAFEKYDLSLSTGFAIKNDKSLNMTKLFNKAEDNMYFNKLLQKGSVRRRTLDAIIDIFSLKCPREAKHSRRVSALCKRFVIELDLEKEKIDSLTVTSLMHDIGKVGVKDYILNKPSALDEEEWAIIKKHPDMGGKILSSIKEFQDMAEIVRQHHERWDGTGYPNGLKGNEIIFEARIIALADAYDSMTNDRPYRKARTPLQAVNELKINAAKYFDPELCRFFVEKVLGFGW